MLGANTLDVDGNLHGAAGQPRPVLLSSANDAVQVLAGASLSDLRIEHSGSFNAVRVFAGTVERVVAHTGTGGSVACTVGDGSLIRDSICWTEGGGGSGNGVLLAQGGVGTRTARLRNVTAVALGQGGRGLFVQATSGGTNTIEAKNVIALGASTDARADASGATAIISFEHSNYDSKVDDPPNGATVTDPGTGTGNQTAAPLFVDAAIGDFHQLAGSPTVNAGALGDLGSADIDGDPRVVGTAPDIGADEFVPSQATPPPSNAFTLGAITRNKRKGTATITVDVSNPGELTASGSGVKAASAGRAVISKSVGAGQAKLLIKAKGKKKRKLNETGRVKLNVTVTYTPTGGSPNARSVKVKLIKR